MNLALVRQQIDNLLLAHPELAEDEFLRADMVEGETDAYDFLRLLERRRQDTEHMTEAIAANIAALNERKARLEWREEVLRKLMLEVMKTADLRKVELPEATISVHNGREKLVINDEASVPKELCYVKYTPNKTLIKAMLKGGTTLNWAAIITGEPGVTIRTG
jgi:Siphovirus Gp157